MRRKRKEAPDSHDRWLVSYADFITLLFAFFVVMFASTQADRGRAKAVSEAIQKALADGRVAPKLAAILGGTVNDQGKGNAMKQGPGGETTVARQPSPERLPALDLGHAQEILRSQLAHELTSGTVRLSLESRGLIISLKAAAFFPSGGDTVDPKLYVTLARVASVLNRVPNTLRLEGHTDSLPINTSRFRSNWELSAARSIAMLRLLKEKYGVERAGMAVAGYADTAPLDSNGTEEGRSRNRRVDVVILSESGRRSEPAQIPPTRHPDQELGQEQH